MSFLYFAHSSVICLPAVMKNKNYFFAGGLCMKRANGTGSIYKMKDRKRRKPWRVRVTVKWILDEGKNITKQELQDLGCFETRREAEAALLQYLDGPYNVKNHNMTFEEVYKEWFEEYTKKKCKESSSQRTVEAAYKYCIGLYKMRIRDIRPYHMKECMSCMFQEAKIGSLNLSSFDTSNVEDMSEMFSHCKIPSLNISSFKTSKVTNMSYMFIRFETDTLDLSMFDISNVKNMMGMFYGCKITTLNLSSFKADKITDVKSMFQRSQIGSLDFILAS